MSSSYGVFAQYYDALTDNVGYAARAKALDALLQKWLPQEMPDRILLDLGCGTGSLCEEMARRGWDVIGIDASEEMLSEALDKKYDSGLPVQYLRQDLRRLDLFGTFSAAVCTLDTLNHLPRSGDVRQVLSRINLFANPGAVLLFDVNTEYKHRFVLGNNSFVFEPPGAVCVWRNQLEDDAPEFPVTIRLDFFEQTEGRKYVRTEEEFTERVWQPALLRTLLEETGFTLLEILDGDSFAAPGPESQRLLFAARASGGQHL